MHTCMLAELNKKRFTMHQMAVFLFILMLMRVISRVKSFDFCFDASLEGKDILLYLFCVCVLSQVSVFCFYDGA